MAASGRSRPSELAGIGWMIPAASCAVYREHDPEYVSCIGRDRAELP